MTLLLRFIGSLIVLSALVVIGNGQNANTSEKDAQTTPPVSFTSIEGRFSIALPKNANGSRQLTGQVPAGKMTGMAITWRFGQSVYGVNFLDRPENPKTINADEILDATRDQLLSQVKAAGGAFVSENPIQMSSYSGRELKFAMPDGAVVFRICLVGNRFYQLLLNAPLDQAEQDAALKILDTFKVISAAEAEAAGKKQIIEATPAPLPQSPVVKKVRTDAEDANLKGKVKTVTTESEDLTGSAPARQTQTIDDRLLQ